MFAPKKRNICFSLSFLITYLALNSIPMRFSFKHPNYIFWEGAKVLAPTPLFAKSLTENWPLMHFGPVKIIDKTVQLDMPNRAGFAKKTIWGLENEVRTTRRCASLLIWTSLIMGKWGLGEGSISTTNMNYKISWACKLNKYFFSNHLYGIANI